jgi:hypothetical protein
LTVVEPLRPYSSFSYDPATTLNVVGRGEEVSSSWSVDFVFPFPLDFDEDPFSGFDETFVDCFVEEGPTEVDLTEDLVLGGGGVAILAFFETRCTGSSILAFLTTFCAGFLNDPGFAIVLQWGEGWRWDGGREPTRSKKL